MVDKHHAGKAKKNSNPLLLRVAGRLNRPLPVYALSNAVPLPAISGVLTHVKYNAPHIRRKSATEIIVDIQEWLSFPMHENAAESLKDTYSNFIARLAETMGGAHHDPSVSPALDALQKSTVANLSVVDAFLLETADTVIKLGEHLLQ